MQCWHGTCLWLPRQQRPAGDQVIVQVGCPAGASQQGPLALQGQTAPPATSQAQGTMLRRQRSWLTYCCQAGQHTQVAGISLQPAPD